MSIDLQTVEKLARLSRLEFGDEEKRKMTTQLNDILGFVSQLQEVDTDNINPMTSAVNEVITPERDDTVTAENNRDNLMQVAPQQEMGFFVVPRVVE